MKFNVRNIATFFVCFNTGLEVSSSDNLNLGQVFSTIVRLRKTTNNHCVFWNVLALLSIT